MPSIKPQALAAAALLGGIFQLANAQEWNFTVLLDGEPIGMHRFVVRTDAAQGEGRRSLRSQAEFRVRLLGVALYSYRHAAQELWRGDCLERLDAQTDDDGERSQVHAREVAGGLQVNSPLGSSLAAGCLMTFAYWNPALRRQQRLLNAQTGRVEQVTWQRMDIATLTVQGQALSATRWRLSGTERPLDVWWTEDGRWVGLDATVRGGRQLSYRLR
ncbi:MAG: hypothetical protein JSS14_15775 [Proteobacteria bacterium]|nr:hypothetical protein [Pseudomonadota bacterium]